MEWLGLVGGDADALEAVELGDDGSDGCCGVAGVEGLARRYGECFACTGGKGEGDLREWARLFGLSRLCWDSAIEGFEASAEGG